MIFDDGTIDANRYIKEILPVVRKCGNNVLGSHWTYQQDGARSNINHLTQDGCANPDHFLDFM